MIDKEKVEAGVRLILEGIGEDVTREGLLETPERVARMYEEIYGGVLRTMEAQEEAARAKTQAQIKSRPRAGTP